MKKILTFLKAKKGKELFELMVMFPIMLFLIIYSTINIVCYITKAETEDMVSNYTRSAITERNYYNALVSIAEEIENEPEEITILEFSITDATTGIKNSISFSNNPDETTYFRRLIMKDKNGNTAVNMSVSDSFKAKNELMSEAWSRGNYITITIQRGILPIINDFSKISIYNASTKERTTFDYGMSGIIKCNTTGVIIG